jgi:hypothetical protein
MGKRLPRRGWKWAVTSALVGRKGGEGKMKEGERVGEGEGA